MIQKTFFPLLVILLFIGSTQGAILSTGYDESIMIDSRQRSSQLNAPQGFDITDSGHILAGACSVAITPDLSKHDPIYLAGFNRDRKATGIHDDIWSRCCCLCIGDTTLAIVSVDLIGIMYSEYKSILERLPPELAIDLVLLTSTHNHEAPDVIGLWGSSVFSGINWEWYEEAMDGITQSIISSYENMQPAGLRFGHDLASGFSRDSRDPQIIDEHLETIQAVNTDAEPIATLVFFGSHPEILWDDNTLITSDYPHYIYDHIEKNNGGTGVFISGALGGLITPQVADHDFEHAENYGRNLAEMSLNSVSNSSILWETTIHLGFKEVFVPLTNPVFRFASFLKILDRPVYHFRRDVLTAVSVVELGEQADILQMISVPGEDFPENWFEIKEQLHADHRIIVGLGMDELGYIVTEEHFDWTTYEESMSASIFLDSIIHGTLEDMLTLR
ncbi:MAG: neutral/alkaline non-lysosomal ceramidase N-terminal domain-containing protein [Thermoplasmatota archaeon]